MLRGVIFSASVGDLLCDGVQRRLCAVIRLFLLSFIITHVSSLWQRGYEVWLLTFSSPPRGGDKLWMSVCCQGWTAAQSISASVLSFHPVHFLPFFLSLTFIVLSTPLSFLSSPFHFQPLTQSQPSFSPYFSSRTSLTPIYNPVTTAHYVAHSFCPFKRSFGFRSTRSSLLWFRSIGFYEPVWNMMCFWTLDVSLPFSTTLKVHL